jgi:hypothetical protein
MELDLARIVRGLEQDNYDFDTHDDELLDQMMFEGVCDDIWVNRALSSK